MTENTRNTSAGPSPIESGPIDGLKFRVIAKKRNTHEQTIESGDDNEEFSFVPLYYPDRFNQTSKKDLQREGQQCRGEDVYIKKFKNAEFHANGVILAGNINTLQNLRLHDGPVDLLTPITPDGGLECIVNNVELGELEGWNPIEDQWMFNYKLDFVSTGRDEYSNDSRNEIIETVFENENEYALTDFDTFPFETPDRLENDL